MMADDDDLDFTTTQKSSRNLGSLFGSGESAPLPSIASTAYVAPKQPKKDSAPRVMVASVIQAFFYGADQKWTPKGKMGVALLSTDNTIFQLILYLTKTQQITSLRLSTNTVFTPQSNNYLSFQDDTAQNWSIMFETKQGLADFALQIVLAKAFLSGFKFDHIIQDIREGEGSNFTEHESVEILLNTYKLIENGTIQSTDSTEVKPSKYKLGKAQYGKAFDDVIRGMKKNGQRVVIISTTLYNIEITRVKRDKERSSSINIQNEEIQPIVETRQEAETHEKSKLLQRIIKEGGQQMFIQPNQSSAFVTPYPMQQSDDDSISVDFHQNIQTRTISTPVPPVQFVQAGYQHPMHPQALMQQQQNIYSPQQQAFIPQTQQLHNYPNRSNSSMGYPQQMSMYSPHSQYPGAPSNIPPTDSFYQQQQQQPHFQDFNQQNDLRPILNRISDKVDALNDKFDTKNSTVYPTMEASLLLSNIERIIKENGTVKKDLFDRSAKVEELNLKISNLLDRNQQLIEQSHQTAEQRNFGLNNESKQNAEKILELEKQKVELTTNLSSATSKIADLQLQLNQFNQNHNENQTKLTTLSQTCEQLRDDLQKSENQRIEFQNQYENAREQYKTEKQTRKQLQTNLNSLEEEFNEFKTNYANLEKANNEKKTKLENDRKRWQNELDEQKQLFDNEIEELQNKLRKQRATDNTNNSQEVNRIEQEWQNKFDKQKNQHEKLFNSKVTEFQELKSLFDQNQTELQQTIEQLNEAKQQIEEYEERCEKLQERCQLMKEKILEMNDEQPQLINEQIKRAINIIFQQLKTRIQPTKQYSGEIFLDKALQIIKKATLKVLSNDEDEDDEDEDEDDEQSEEEIQQTIQTDSIDRQTLSEEIISTPENNQTNSSDSETSTNNQKNNGWDTVDDLQQETNLQNQEQEQQSTENTDENPTTTTVQPETVVETTSSEQTIDKDHETDNSTDTVEDNQPKPIETEQISSEQKTDTKDDSSDGGSEDEMFKSARPSIQDSRSSAGSAASKPSFSRNIPLLPNPDDSDDELFK